MKQWGCFAVAVAVFAAAAPAHAQSSPDIEPDAIAALNKMGNYLRTLKVFQVRAENTDEDVYEDGQKVQYASVVDLLARAPDRLRTEVTNDRQQRLFLYNGSEFTMWGERVRFYATVPAPPTIAQLVDRLKENFDIDTPLVDLFYWGSQQSDIASIKSAMDVGPSQVAGTTCEQYAFRQPGLDWQIWIQQGDYPLPRKLVLTTTTDDARPQHSSVLTWSLAPSFNESSFQFDPPDDAHKIALAEVK